MANLGPPPVFQFVDLAGEPMFLGKVYTYAAGTDTPLATYTDSGAGTPNTNPVILDEYGSAAIWFGPTAYKLVIATPDDVVIRTVNNFSAGNGGGVGYFADGDAAAPGIAFSTDATTGIYRTTSPLAVNISVGGVQHSQFKSGQLLTGNGSAALPAYGFLNATTTGVFYDTGTLGLSTAGVLHFGVKSDGRIYGTALHNVGTITGTTDQFIASGTYTPNPTGVTNILTGSILVSAVQYVRVGNVVILGGNLTMSATAGGNANTVFRLSLPIASNFSGAGDAGGTASIVDAGTATANCTIVASAANDALSFNFNAPNTTLSVLSFNAVYLIRS